MQEVRVGPDDLGDMRSPSQERVGLCASCRNVQVIESARGSTFYLCRLAAVDAAFPKYPRLPVLRCAGYEAAAQQEARRDEEC